MFWYDEPVCRANAPLETFLLGIALWASSLAFLALSGATV